jgi:Spy/CpxP family protein refolding chaperone
MKKLQLLVAALLLVVTTSAASAQDGQRRGGGNRAAALLQGITLTAEQQAKVDTLGQKTMADMMAMRGDTTMTPEARRAKGNELFAKQAEAIKALLTPEQKTVFEKNWADMQARMQQQGGGRPPQRD